MGIDVSVRCAPTWEETDDVTTKGTAFSVFDINTIRLQEDGVCDKLSGDVNDVLSGSRHGVDVDRKLDIASVILLVAHEGAHHKHNAKSEAVTEC